MAKGFLSRAAAAIRRDLGNEFAYALDDIRHKVVEQPMAGRPTTPSVFTPNAFEISPEAASFYRWLGEKEADKGKGDQEKDGKDPMGRTAEAAPEPMEGRPSEVKANYAVQAAFERHAKVGPTGAMEMEDYYRNQWRDFEGWIDGRETALSGDAIEEESRAQERAQEGAEHEID